MSTTRILTKPSLRAICLTLAGLLSLHLCALAGCAGGNERPRQARRVTPIVRDVPAPLRTAVGAQTVLAGVEPVLVTGYGFVVGLHGNGGKPLPPDVQSTMEREMALRGVGRGGAGADLGLVAPDGRGLSPRELLSHPDTAVVVAYALVPPGSPEGMTFDVFVQALNADSLQGGVLYTTELRFGPANPIGGVQARKLGVARGAVFVNPFADAETSGAQLNIGRILDGGLVTDGLQIEAVLDNPSHARARGIAQAINARFPLRPGDRSPAASGRDDSSVALRVPDRFRETPGDFVNIVRHMPTNIGIPAEEHARRFTEALKEEPGLSEELMWALISQGEAAVPQVRDLYEYPELAPRRAAIRAGVYLEDPLVTPVVLETAINGEGARQVEAVRLAASLPRSTRTDAALRDLLGSSNIAVRIAAYESLAQRASAERLRQLREQATQQIAAGGEILSEEELRVRARLWFNNQTAQGIRRRLSAGKFIVDVLDSDRSLIYATLQREPRIAIVGDPDAEIQGPLFISLWNDRVAFSIADGESRLLARVRRKSDGRAIWREAPKNLSEFVDFLSRETTPEDPRPGMNLSYSEVVGALHALWSVGAIVGDFTTEQDRLLAELIEASGRGVTPDRPARPGEDPEWPLEMPPLPGAESADGESESEEFRPRLIPLDGGAASNEGGS